MLKPNHISSEPEREGPAGKGAGIDESTDLQHQKEVVLAVRQEIDSLLRQRAEIIKRLDTAKRTLMGLSKLFGSSAATDGIFRSKKTHQTGLTNGCRTVLLQAKTPLTTHQVRDKLRFGGLSLDNHRDPIASVNTILERLRKYGEVRRVTLPHGKRAWEWIANRVELDESSANHSNS